MGKVTFVVEFEDGKEPAVNAGTDILGGKMASVSWRDVINEGEWINCADRSPAIGVEVLAIDDDGSYETVVYSHGFIPGPPFYGASSGHFTPTHWQPLPEPPAD